jgi:hypothetical protein
MKRMLRKWLGIDHYEPVSSIEARDVLSGTEMAFVAYRIDNGYLLRMGGGLTLQNPIIYCTDEKDMIEKIVVYRSKVKLTGAQMVMTGSDYAAKSNKY